MNPEQFSIIIPTCNRSTHLTTCIGSFVRQDYPADSFEIIVVDDGSRDETGIAVQKAIESNPTIRIYYFFQPNRGVSAARNRGLEQASCECVIFMDDDCFVEKNFLRTAHACIAPVDDRSVLLVQVNLKNPEPDTIYGVLWEYIFQSRILHERNKYQGKYVDLLGGVFIANTHYLKHHPFDEHFTTAAEDTDLKRRLQAPKLFFPELVVYHTPRHRLIDAIRQRFHYGAGYERLKRKWAGKQEGNDSFDFSPYLTFKALRQRFGMRAFQMKGILYVYSISTRAGMYSEILDRPSANRAGGNPGQGSPGYPVSRSPGNLRIMTLLCTVAMIDLISMPFRIVRRVFGQFRG
jgi:glycosyltransferase involved in cell wall biosynthesis